MMSREDQERREAWAHAHFEAAFRDHGITLRGETHVACMYAMEYEAAHQRARYERLVKAAELAEQTLHGITGSHARTRFVADRKTMPDGCDCNGCSAKIELRAALADLREPEGGGDG